MLHITIKILAKHTTMNLRGNALLNNDVQEFRLEILLTRFDVWTLGRSNAHRSTLQSE